MILSFCTFGTPTAVLSLELDESKSSLIEQLNETTRFAVTLTAPFAPALKVGMYTTYNGSDYYLIAEPSVTKVHSESYIIEADLESVAGLTKATILSNPIDKRTSFDYTATAREHLQLIADSLNQKLTNSGLKWAVGGVNCRNDVRHIKYDHVTTWTALQRIRETYKTDIAINGTTISLGIPGDKASALELSYGKDKGLLSGLERVKHSDTPTPSRLYVTGTKRNLVKGTLTLQPSQILKIDGTGRVQRITTPGTGRVYTTDKDGRYVEIFTTDTTRLRTEATYTNEEIYPSHVSKVTTVEKVRDHFEVNSDLDLDYNKQTISGEQKQIVFQSGNLAGREFDAIYKTSTKRFAITPKEEDETTLPNDILCPKVGDRYIITGIELPQQYIDEAQEKLTDAAVTQLEEMQNTRYSYKAEVDPVYLYNNRTAIADKLTVGKYVHLTDTQIAQGDPYIRITSKRTYLDRIYQPEIELSNEVEEYSFFERLKDSFSEIARIDRKEELARINKQIDVTMPDRIKDKIKGDTELQELLKGRDGKDGRDGTDGAPGKDGHTPKLELGSDGYLYIDRVKQSTLLKGRDGKDGRDGTDGTPGAPGKDGENPNPSDVADLIANSKTYRDRITDGLPDENRVKELARELDNERKVGGRNLFREKYFEGGITCTFRIPFEAVTPRAEYNTYTLSFDYKISADDKASSPRVSIRYKKASTFVWDSKVIRDGAWHHKVITFTLEKMDESEYPLTGWLTDYGSSNGRTIDMVAVRNIKLERGNVATDWTPAPEDMLSELSKYTTLKQYKTDRAEDSRKLDNKLDKPTSGKYVLDTDIPKRFEELMKVGGRNLIVTKRWEAGYLYGDSTNGNPGEPEYKVIPNHSKFRYDPTYISTEGNKTITRKLYDNGGDNNGVVQIHAYDKDKKFLWWDFDAWRGEIGRTRTYTLPADTSYIRLGVTNENVRAKVEFGNVATDWTPAPEDLFGALDNAKLELNQTINDGLSKKADTSALDSAKRELNQTITDGLKKAVSTLDFDGFVGYVGEKFENVGIDVQSLRAKDKELEAKQMQDDEREWLKGVMRKLIPSDIDPDAFANGKFVAMSSDLSLRSSNGSPTALLGGSTNKKQALLLAGIKEYGTDNQTEQTAIYEDGSAKFGEVSIANDRIELKSKKGEPLALTADDAVFVEDVVARGKINEDSLSISTKAITNSSSGVKLGDFSVANDGTKVTISIGKLTSEVYAVGKSMLLMLDVDILGSWSGKTELVDTGGGAFGKPNFSIDKTPLVAQNLTWERYLNKGSHTLLAIIYSNVNTDKGRIEGLNVHQSYDASKMQTLISQSGVRAYGGSARYFDVDARMYVPLAGGNVIPNYYTARVKGGMRLDSLTLEQPLDAPGCVLAGGEVDSSGSVVKSFGKYKKRRGGDSPYTTFDYDTKLYTIYHSIGNTNYIPVVTSRSSAWADVPRVMSIDSNSFTIKFINQENTDSNWRQMFIYVCYKAD